MSDSLQRVTGLAWFQNRIWAASYGAGLFFLDGKRWQHWDDKTVPRFLTCLSANNQQLWYSTWMEGKIGYLDVGLRSLTIPLPELVTPRFVYRNNCLIADGASVWIGTEGYLLGYSMQAKDWTTILSVGAVRSLQKRHSSLWVSTEESLMVLDLKQSVPCLLRVALRQVEISALALDGDTLWLGGQLRSRWRVGQYSISKERFVPVNAPFEGWVNAIVATTDRVFFAVGSGSRSFYEGEGFSGGGVFLYDKRRRSWSRVESSLADAWCLLKVGQTLWVGGFAGVQWCSDGSAGW